MNIRRAALSVIALLIGLSVAGAQVVIQQQNRPGTSQPRDRAQQKTGTAMISGRITAADTGAPLRRVQVRIMGSELRGPRTALTDADGRYFARELPAGRYNVFATKPGYTALSYGQKRPVGPGPFQQGTPIELSDGQKMETANIALPRGGVIVGHVFDDFGEPVVDARVAALQYRWFNGRRRAVPTGRMATTNDRGEFRIWGLAPGEYYVGAASNNQLTMGTSPDELTGTSAESTGYAPVYYPGTGSIDEAQRVTVPAAQEIAGIDMSLSLVRTVRVSGTAVASDGRPMTRGFVSLIPRTEVEGATMIMGGGGGSVDSNGAFTINGVAPGEYVLVVRGGEPAGGSDGAMPEFASATINVGNEDLKGVVVTAAKGVRVSGKISYEGGTPSDGVDRMRVSAFPSDLSAPMMMMGGVGSAPVNAQGTFELRGILGKRRINVGPLPNGWWLKSVRIGSADVTDTGYDFGKEDVTNIDVVLTNRVAVVTGTVRDAKGEPATDATVLIFPVDEEYWSQAMSRRITTGRLDQNGTYRIRALPPGTYYAMATDSQPDEWGNPELFPKLKTLATSFSVSEGETQTLELRLKELPQ